MSCCEYSEKFNEIKIAKGYEGIDIQGGEILPNGVKSWAKYREVRLEAHDACACQRCDEVAAYIRWSTTPEYTAIHKENVEWKNSQKQIQRIKTIIETTTENWVIKTQWGEIGLCAVSGNWPEIFFDPSKDLPHNIRFSFGKDLIDLSYTTVYDLLCLVPGKVEVCKAPF